MAGGLLDFLGFGGGQQPMQAQTSMQQPQQGGLFSGRLGILNDPSVALPLAGALMQPGDMGSNLGQGFALAGQGVATRKKLAQEQLQQNMTAKYLESQGADPALVEMAKSGGGAQALQAWQQSRKDPLDDIKLQTAQLQLERLRNPDANDEEFYGNPINLQDEQGNPYLGQLSNRGNIKRIDTGGLKITPGVQKVDLGDSWGFADKAGNIISTQPKNLANAERQKEVGAQQGKNEAAASADAQSAQNALDLVDELRTDPNRERGTGKSSIFNSMPATAGYDFQTKVDQAKSGAFLTAIQQMRGMGALSNAEGSTATQAVTRMNTATTEQGFLDALDAYEKIVRQGLERAQRRLPQQQPSIQPPSPQGGGGATSSGVQWKVIP
jgi:hypothetical protein